MRALSSMILRGRRRTKALLLVLVLAVIFPLVVALGPASAAGIVNAWPGPQPAPGDWPQVMRGGHHTGWNRVENTLTRSTVRGLSIAWMESNPPSEMDLSGTPTVVGQSVFLGGAQVTARRVDTGATLWQTLIGGGISTTPAYGHGIVVASDTENPSTIAGLDASTGAILWSRRLGGTVSSSPSISGKTVYIGFELRVGFAVLALRLRTGRTMWKWTTAYNNFGLVSSPTADGSSVYFSLGGGTKLVALDAATGGQRWSLTLDSGNGWTIDGLMVSLQGGRIYAGNVAGAVYAIDAATGVIVWRTDIGGASWRPVAVTPHAVLVIKDFSTLVALSPADGSELWTYSIHSTMSPGVSAAGGLVYVGSSARGVGRLDVLNIRTGGRRARIDLVGTYLEPEIPAVSAGRVLVASTDTLLALTLPGTGAVQRPVRVADRPPVGPRVESIAPVFTK